MPLKVRCDNLVHYDPQSGRYQRCDREIEVTQDRLGGLVECPECGHWVSVPALLAPTNDSAKAPSTGKATEPATTPARSVSSARRSEPQESTSRANPSPPLGSTQDTGPSPPKRTSAAASRESRESNESSSPAANEADLFSGLPAAEKRLSSAVLDGRPCDKCGQRVPPGAARCMRCGEPRKALWRDDPLSKDALPVPAGFQLWCLGMLASGIRPFHLRLAMGGVIAVISMLCLGLATYGGMTIVVVVLVMVLLVAAAFAKICLDSMRLASKPAAKLALWQRWGWSGVRQFLKAINWQFAGSRLPTETRLSLAGQPITDQMLLEEPRINHVRWLDLSDTKITDEGLRYLRGLQRLEYLLVQRTDVSDEGVYRLQQTIPRCWIWK